MRSKLDDLPEYFRKQAIEQIAGIPVRSPDVEPGAINEPAGTDEAKENHSPVSIHIHSIRKRLTDSDGVCAKWLIDGIVAAGILPDDSPAEVGRTSYSQELAKRKNNSNY